MELSHRTGIILGVLCLYLIIIFLCRQDDTNGTTVRPRTYRTRSSYPSAKSAINVDINPSPYLTTRGETRVNETSLKLNRSTSDSEFIHPCFWRVQFWTKFTPTMPDGRHYCAETNCTVEFTTKKSYDVMTSSHVVILHHKGNWDMEKIKSARSPGQILVYWSRESPLNSYHRADMSPFNWTATYHTSSHIPIPYGRIIPIDQSPQSPTPTKNRADGKTGLAIWIASNCHSTSWGRSKFVGSLRKFADIDTYGQCGDRKCPQGGAGCLEMIKSYKFYLSLENSWCDEYITEKFWRNALAYDSVPIVFGAPKRDYERLGPKDSFIHVSDFRNASSLAAYIKRIDQNDTLYNEFFKWRVRQTVRHVGENGILDEGTLCSISEKLLHPKILQRNDNDDVKWFMNSCHKMPLPTNV